MRFGGLQHHLQQQQQQRQQQQQAQQAQQAQQLNSLCFDQNPEGTSSLRANVFGGRSVLQGPGVLLFRRRPLELRCGAVFEGMGATLWSYSFLSVQKAMLGSEASGQHVFGGRSGVAKTFWRRAASAPAAPAAAAVAAAAANSSSSSRPSS